MPVIRKHEKYSEEVRRMAASGMTDPEIAEKFGLEGFGNIVVDDDGRLKIQAEFENFDADLYLSRIEEQSYLHCWDRLPSEFPEK